MVNASSLIKMLLWGMVKLYY